MRYELFIGLRYLRAKRKEAFVSLITLFSILGVFFGVTTLNVVLAVMTGLEEDLRDRILGFNPHIVVLSHTGSVADYPAVVERLRTVPGIVRAEPFVYGQAMLSTPDGVAGVLVRGVRADDDGAVDLRRHLKEGDLAALARLHIVTANDGRGGSVELPGMIVGKELAQQLQVEIGDPVSVISPFGSPSVVGFVPRVRRFVVVGWFVSGMSEYDSSLAYVDLHEAQRFFGLKNTVTGVELRTGDLYRAREIAGDIARLLDFPYRVRDWMEMNHSLFAALKLEKTVYFLVLLLIVLVAAFNIVATLIMVVMEKRKDIAILKSMGAPRTAIARVFVFKGVIIGTVGTALGDLCGFAACWALAKYQFIDLPIDVFYTDKLPVKMYPEYFALVTGASLLMCLLATVYPARQAARLAPVDVLRYE
jgi:lipoprotein-releasing system permease protein